MHTKPIPQKIYTTHLHIHYDNYFSCMQIQGSAKQLIINKCFRDSGPLHDFLAPAALLSSSNCK